MKTPIENLILTLQKKVNNIPDSPKESRARKGAYVAAILLAKDLLDDEERGIKAAHLAGQNSAEEFDGETEIEYFNDIYKD